MESKKKGQDQGAHFTNLNVPVNQNFERPDGLSNSKSIRFKNVGDSLDPRKNPNDFEGYLYKYSPSIFKGWQKRYIILKDKKLMYKKTME